MKTFEYHRPTSPADAVALLAASEDAKPIAGGMTLLPTMKMRLNQPEALVDLSAIPGLAGISVENGVVTVGAMTRHADVAASAEVKAAIPALAALAGGIGDPQVRHRGTIGGSIANADPAADYPAAVLGLGATVVTDRREIPGGSFFEGLFTTALAPDEIVTAVRFPIPDMAAYAKFKNPASRFAIVGVMVSKTGGNVTVAVTGAGPSAFRSPEVEEALSANFAPEALAAVSVDPAGLNSDIHADAEYRAHLIVAMARRAVAAALGGAA